MKTIKAVAALPLSQMLVPQDPLASKEWHSILREVYHNNRSCTEGNNIEAWYLHPGTGGKRLCRRCKKLNKEQAGPSSLPIFRRIELVD